MEYINEKDLEELKKIHIQNVQAQTQIVALATDYAAHVRTGAKLLQAVMDTVDQHGRSIKQLDDFLKSVENPEEEEEEEKPSRKRKRRNQ